MNLTKRVVGGMLIILGILCATLGLAQQNRNMKTLVIAPQAEIRFPAQWQPSAVQYSNARELVARRTEPPAPRVTAAESGEAPLARMLITTEPRTSHADALKRLEAIVASRNAPAEFVEVGGWPAVELKFTEQLPRRGAKGEEEGGTPMPDVTVQRTITAIAQGDKVVVMDTTILPSAPQALVSSAKDITRSVRFAKKADPNAVKKALETMRNSEKQRQLRTPQSSLPNTGPAAESPSPTESAPVESPAAKESAPAESTPEASPPTTESAGESAPSPAAAMTESPSAESPAEAARAAPSNAGAAVRVQGAWVNWKSFPALMPRR